MRRLHSNAAPPSTARQMHAFSLCATRSETARTCHSEDGAVQRKNSVRDWDAVSTVATAVVVFVILWAQLLASTHQ